MILVTTFSEAAYYTYGKRWIESVNKFWPYDTKVVIYVDFEINSLPSNFVVKSFKKNFLDYQIQLKKRLDEKYKNTTEKNKIISQKTLQFSFKSYVIQNELHLKEDKIIVWLDSDVETISNINERVILKELDDKFLACQTEKQKYKYPHIESGILIFNTTKCETSHFQKEFFEYYTTDKIFKLKKPYDGYVIGRILIESHLDFKDFNSNIITIGKKSNQDETFLHPFLKKHFIHWIGDNKF
jgi:hypothetical protein